MVSKCWESAQDRISTKVPLPKFAPRKRASKIPEGKAGGCSTSFSVSSIPSVPVSLIPNSSICSPPFSSLTVNLWLQSNPRVAFEVIRLKPAAWRAIKINLKMKCNENSFISKCYLKLHRSHEISIHLYKLLFLLPISLILDPTMIVMLEWP